MNWLVNLGCGLAMVWVCATAAQADASGTPHSHDTPDWAETLPIFDAHIHYKQPAWSVWSPEEIIRLMDGAGVAMGLVSSSPDEGTIRLYDHAPARIVPELRPYHGRWGSSNWTDFDGIANYLTDKLNTHNHAGIGEFHIRNRLMWDEELFRNIIKLARERDIYLHVHSGAEPIGWLYGLDPEVKIIWAHAGLGEPADVVYETMKKYPALMADTSLREWAIMGPGGQSIDPEWERIIIAFQDRLMVGSDTWVNAQWEEYGPIIASNRAWLALLPREVAEKIAFGNAERIFGRAVTRELIGTR